jgi:hypothetical protein
MSALALTAGVATASTPAASADCPDLLQALITAQILDTNKSTDLRNAEKADADARDTNNSAAVSAQSAYKAGQPYHGTPEGTETQVQADQRADDAAKAERDAKVKAADDAYTAGGTATRLAEAQREEGSTAGTLARLKVDVGRLCVTPAPPAGGTTVINPPAPAPVVQGSDKSVPVTH